MSKSHPLPSDAWKELRAALVAKINAARPYTQMDEKSRLYAQLSASWITSTPWDEDEETLRAAKLAALAAIVEHAPQYAKAMHAVRVVKQDEISVTFEVPSISSPGTFYRPTLYKSDCGVICSCEGRARTGHCWHQLACREAFCLMQPMACLQDVVTEDEFARTDDLSDVFDAMFDAIERPARVGYASEARKPSKPLSLSADAIARSKAPVSAENAAYFDALLEAN